MQCNTLQRSSTVDLGCASIKVPYIYPQKSPVQYNSAEEPYISAGEPCISAKQPHLLNFDEDSFFYYPHILSCTHTHTTHTHKSMHAHTHTQTCSLTHTKWKNPPPPTHVNLLHFTWVVEPVLKSCSHDRNNLVEPMLVEGFSRIFEVCCKTLVPLWVDWSVGNEEGKGEGTWEREHRS